MLSINSSPANELTDEVVLIALAEESALLRVCLGKALVGEAAGELFLSWVSTLSLTDVISRFCKLSGMMSRGGTTRGVSVGRGAEGAGELGGALVSMGAKGATALRTWTHGGGCFILVQPLMSQ